jgi:Protein of unknown function (DUF2933)
MEHPHSYRTEQTAALRIWSYRYVVGLLVGGAFATYFLLSEHRAQFTGALPFLLLLACPLMHLFMHHGHGRDDESHRNDKPSAKKSAIAQANGEGISPTVRTQENVVE